MKTVIATGIPGTIAYYGDDQVAWWRTETEIGTAPRPRCDAGHPLHVQVDRNGIQLIIPCRLCPKVVAPARAPGDS